MWRKYSKLCAARKMCENVKVWQQKCARTSKPENCQFSEERRFQLVWQVARENANFKYNIVPSFKPFSIYWKYSTIVEKRYEQIAECIHIKRYERYERMYKYIRVNKLYKYHQTYMSYIYDQTNVFIENYQNIFVVVCITDSIFNWIFGGIWTVMLTRIALFFPNGPKLTTWKLQQATFKFSGGLCIFTIIIITTFQLALWRAIYKIRSRTTDMV